MKHEKQSQQSHRDFTEDASPPVKVETEPATVCSVCGQGGNLSGAAGAARWHADCETSHPAVIQKVKARA